MTGPHPRIITRAPTLHLEDDLKPRRMRFIQFPLHRCRPYNRLLVTPRALLEANRPHHEEESTSLRQHKASPTDPKAQDFVSTNSPTPLVSTPSKESTYQNKLNTPLTRLNILLNRQLVPVLWDNLRTSMFRKEKE